MYLSLWYEILNNKFEWDGRRQKIVHLLCTVVMIPIHGNSLREPIQADKNRCTHLDSIESIHLAHYSIRTVLKKSFCFCQIFLFSSCLWLFWFDQLIFLTRWWWLGVINRFAEFQFLDGLFLLLIFYFVVVVTFSKRNKGNCTHSLTHTHNQPIQITCSCLKRDSQAQFFYQRINKKKDFFLSFLFRKFYKLCVNCTKMLWFFRHTLDVNRTCRWLY